MVFIRVKKISNNYYYYLVKSIRINGKIRQKVVRYIGKSKNLVSMIENFQQADGSVKIPEVLRKYMGGKEFIK